MKIINKIDSVKRFRYEATTICLIRVKDLFIFIVPYRGEAFINYSEFRQPWHTRFAAWMGWIPLYNSDELDEIEYMMVQSAIKQVDTFRNEKSEVNKNLDEVQEKTKDECDWQARMSKEGLEKADTMYCRTHDQEVKITNKIPKCPKAKNN